MSNEALSKSLRFTNPGGQLYRLTDVIRALKNYVEMSPEANYEIAIGTDSRADVRNVTFVSSIVFRRIGNGGIYFFARTVEKGPFTMRDRIWRETMLSITLAQELRGQMRSVLGEEPFWNNQITLQQIHCDVGTKGETKNLVDGVTGMVKGFGFEPVIKPYAYSAFVVADLHT